MIRYIWTHANIADKIPKMEILPKNIVDNKGIHSSCFKKRPFKVKYYILLF